MGHQGSGNATAQGRVSRADPVQLDVGQITDRLYSAILEHRIPPGTKLAEERLSDIFSVSRARVRQVLARLANRRVVEIVPHRGAHVAKPTVTEAKDIFESRRLIEPFTVRKLVELLDHERTARLRAQLELEQQARATDDRRSIIRLSGEFHILLAELAGNVALTRMTRELAIRTCLIISLYSQSTIQSCRADEHADIVEAITRADAEGAVKRLNEHLNHIERSLDLSEDHATIDLEAVLDEA